MKSKELRSLNQSQDSLGLDPAASISINDQIAETMTSMSQLETLIPETAGLAEQVLAKGPQRALDLIKKDLPLMSMLLPSGQKRRSKSNQNLGVQNPLMFKKEIDDKSQEERVRNDKSLEEERKKVNDRLENLYSQFRTRNMLLENTALRSQNKTEKHIVAGATYKNTTHMQKESKMNYADLAFLESKVALRDYNYQSIVDQDSPMKSKIQLLPDIQNTLSVLEDKFSAVEKNLTNFVIHHKQQTKKHKRTATEKIGGDNAPAGKDHAEVNYHQIP